MQKESKAYTTQVRWFTHRYYKHISMYIYVCIIHIYIYILIYLPCRSKDYVLNGCSIKTTVLERVYNQQFQGTILLMVIDLQASRVYIYI